MAVSVFSTPEEAPSWNAQRQASAGATTEDVAAMLHGTVSFLAALHKVWPQAGDDELAAKASELIRCPAGVELLHMVMQLRKITVE